MDNADYRRSKILEFESKIEFFGLAPGWDVWIAMAAKNKGNTYVLELR